MQLMYPGLAARVFSIFRCRDFGEFVLARNVLVECYTGRHAMFQGLSVLFMVLYVAGMPLAIFVALWRNRKHLHDATPKHEEIKYEFGALYMQFTPKYWYFEIIIILNKMLMTGALSVIEPGSPLQLVLATLVMLCFTLVTLKLAPYKSSADDWTSFLVSFVITCNTQAGFVLLMDKDTRKFNPDNIDVLLMILNVGVLIVQLLT